MCESPGGSRARTGQSTADLHLGVATMVARAQPDRKQLPLVLLRLLCLLPTGLPVRSVDFNRGTDNITVRQGDTAILR